MTEDLLIRSFEPELEIVRGAGDGRTVSGVAVPYGKAQRINDQLTEQFAAGAFRRQMGAANRVAFARDHLQLGGILIGRLDTMTDTASGLRFEARVAKTQAGDDTLALIEVGALRENSVGFRPRQNRTLPDGTIERVTAELREVAVVLEGAYGRGATIGQVRADGGGADTHTPPAGVQAAAKRAQQAIDDGKAGEGLTAKGRQRAADLAAGRPVSRETAGEMVAFFGRHEGDEGRDTEGTPAWVAWQAWGGDAGRRWAQSIVDGDRVDSCPSCGHVAITEPAPTSGRSVEVETLLAGLPERLPL